MAKLSLRLFIDEEKNKVILAEAGRDFVDTLFSVLTLPVGTIVRMLKQHNKESQSVSVGCLNNIYTSIEDMSIENFRTEACKQMLLYPRSVNDEECRKLKLYENEIEPLKYFMCPSCTKFYSNFDTSICSCGDLMEKEIELEEEESDDGESVNGVFVKGGSFIITDDMKVMLNSTGLVMKTLIARGSSDVNKLRDLIIDVGVEEVLTLLVFSLSSDSPLTDTFLKKQSSKGMTKMNESPSLYVKQRVVKKGHDQVIVLNLIMKKNDKKVLYVECGEDFIDLLCTFLVVPFEYAMKISSRDSISVSIDNLLISFKGLGFGEETKAASYKCALPWFYNCHNQLLDVITQEPPVYYRFMSHRSRRRIKYYKLTSDSKRCLRYVTDELLSVLPVDPKARKCSEAIHGSGSGFVNEGLKFVVSDDLICKPMDSSSSTIDYLKKFQVQLNDIEEQVISFRKDEALSLFRASFLSSSPLDTAFKNFVLKKMKEEA